MFIADSYMLYPPSALTFPSSAPGVPIAGVPFPIAAAFAGPLITSGVSTHVHSSSLSLGLHLRHSTSSASPGSVSSPPPSPVVVAAAGELAIKKMTGFNVSDILDREPEIHVPKRAPCVIISSRTQNNSRASSVSPDAPCSGTPGYQQQPQSVHQNGPLQHQYSPFPPTVRSPELQIGGENDGPSGFCPAAANGNRTPPSAVTMHSRELKFGVERILSNDLGPRKALSPCTMCVSPMPSTRTSVPQAALRCDCAHPLCDGSGNIYPFYAYPTASLTRAVPYQTCAMYQVAANFTSEISESRSHHANSQSSSGKRKRSWSRAVFSNLQRKGLEKRFQIQKYITKPDRRQLAATLGLTDAQVKVWFQNRRMKWRHSKEAREELAKQNAAKSEELQKEKNPASITVSDAKNSQEKVHNSPKAGITVKHSTTTNTAPVVANKLGPSPSQPSG